MFPPGGVMTQVANYQPLEHLSTFTAADSTLLTSYTPEIGNTWSALSGVPRIYSNHAAAGSAGQPANARVVTNLSDGVVEADVRAIASGQYCDVVFRYSSASQYWFVRLSNDVRLWTYNSGLTQRGIWSTTLAYDVTHNIRVVLSGANTDVYVDDVLRIQSTYGYVTTATTHGFYVYTFTANTSWVDNFKVYTP